MISSTLTFLRRSFPILLGIGLFGLGLYALYHLLRPVDPADVMAHIRATPWHSLIGAVLATAVGYAALVGYDVFALHFIGHRLPWRVVGLGGFLGYAFGNTIGVSIVSGGAVRYRIYSAFGLNAFEVAAVSAYIAMALGTGLTLIGLAALAVHPMAASDVLPLSPGLVRWGSLAVLVISVAVIVFISWGNRSLKVWRFDLRLPPPRSLAGQLAVTLIDVVAAAYTLWVLMPAGTPDFASFVAIYAIAMMIGILSHVPGGVGVFETVVIGTLPPEVPVSEAAAALLMFRMIYYILPFVLGFVIVSVNEARMAGGFITRLMGRLPAQSRPVTEALGGVVPSLVGLVTFGFGVYLLMASLIPSVRGDAMADRDVIAALLIEGGTLASAVAGVLLLILSHGLARRVEAAFWLTQAVLAGGLVASLLNGFDVDSALLLGAGLLLLLPFRGAFHRKAKLTEGVFSPAWFALVLGVVLAAAVFFFFVHRTTPYSNDLWTEIAHGANTPRALRAGLVASAILLFFGIYLALRPVRSRPVRAQDPGVLERAAAIVAAAGDPQGCIGLSGDKRFLFSDAGGAFIMYGVQGSTWVALSDPVGRPEEVPDLCWAFIDQAQRANCRPMFYEVGPQHLPVYVDLGMALHKVGEEAVIPLQNFSLSGAAFKSLRATHNRQERDGLRMELLTPPHDAALLAELATVSEAWLGGKTAREKGFSVGRFEPSYLARFPIAVVRRAPDGPILAFANVLAPGDGRRVSVDLMRYLPDEASGMMEFLFLTLMEHYRDLGATEFSLGVAPLAGLSERSVGRLWNRFGRLIYRHGGAFYNFAGLRAFKQKFHPDWQPRYIAVPPGLSPTRAMTDVALLIAGGARGLLRK